MIQIRVNVIQHPFSSGMHNLYSVFVDGVLLCTTEDDNEGFNVMVAKERIEAKKVLEGQYINARGILPVTPGTKLPEVRIRQTRDED